MPDRQETPSIIIPIVMAGGVGARLWPTSRQTMPKQFIPILDNGLSTFQATLQRVSGRLFSAPIVITGNDFRFVVAEQMKALGISGEIVLEPQRRDSAAAVAVGSVIAAKRQDGAICLVLAADHAITDEAAFVSDCKRAAREARVGRIMTLGIVPTFPSTAYGYIAIGKPLAEPGAFVSDRFVEKPDKTRAAAYVQEGLVWNSGNFIYDPATMLEELAAFAPEILIGARDAVESGQRDLDFIRLDPRSFEAIPQISIDYAIMEKTARAGVLRASFGWSDLGSWDSIYDFKMPDDNGNILDGTVSVLETRGSFVRSEGPLTAVVGLDNVIVVTTPDAVLVTTRESAPKVKNLVSQLAAEGYREASEHLRAYRPWGWFQRIDIGDRFQVKHICVKPGGTLSLQRHYHRAEHWVIVHGIAEVTIDGAVKLYHENEAAYLPIGCAHRMHNPGKIDLKIIEVQVGSYTGEDDIVRIADIYARN